MYVSDSPGGSALDPLGPQALLDNLPANLQPGSTLFYYNPQAEDLMLQQAALQQTGKASFIDGLTYDSEHNLSVTAQEKEILYQNAIDYAKANNLQLGDALTQAQLNTLSAPMLWYVEQSVPDPGCVSTGPVGCPTVTALMPQVYLPQNWSAMSADGTITGKDVTLNFNQDGNGSILNTGDITASNTLTVNTGTLTNQANQVNVGQIWSYINEAGYSKTTGTAVQPGGFMSAANMNLNVQTLNQIGGALQQLNADGTIDQSGTQQMLAQLQQQLGTSFTQTTVSDNLHTDFVAQGGFGASQIVGLAFAVVVAIMTAGAASAAIGAVAAEGSTFAAATAATTTAEGVAMPAMTAGLGNIALSAAAAGFTSSIASQLTMTGQLSWASAFEAAGIAGITAGLTNGITYNSNSGLDFTTQPLAVGGATNSIAGLAGVNPVAGTNVSKATTTTASLTERGLAMLAEAGISAGVGTAVEGGSFATAFEHALTGELAASGAFTIGDATDPLSLQNIFAHAALGCAASAVEGTGCAGGAIGGAASAAINPIIDANGNIPPAMLAGIETLVSGSVAGALGFNVQGAVTAAQNETFNNWLNHVRTNTMFLSEQERYDNAVASGDRSTVDSLNAQSQQRDAALASACAGGLGSPDCQAQVKAALAGGNDVQVVNGRVYAFDPGAPGIKVVGDSYQSIYAGSFDGQVAVSTLDGLQMAPIPLPVLGLLGKFGNLLGLGTADASRFAPPLTTSLDVSEGAANRGATGSVWDSITATQPNYPGSVIPQSFEMSLPNGQSVWVHGNATEHMAEYAQMVANNSPPGMVQLTTQQQLSSLQNALNTATQGGVPYNQLINVGGWELKFAPPRQPGQLPALIHALATGK